ncbi:hypothetical protein FOL47_009427 [Perkinsus chesapeaki]|uniref:Uncharacterized protein n=1 Tax=Perkinsus chesapeaki TaxID=330153 RepID=A0A7J6L8C6_PERCH|nr:hypothetical protein FOL47_009427 [Perkinsus chesapeaki]
MMYTGLGISGDEDFTVAPDNYLYYRHGGDAVYRKPLDDPTAQGELYAGGCGCGMNDNQVCTAGYGNLVYYTPDGSSSGQLVMQDYNDEVNFRFLGFCPCKPSTTTTTSHTTAGVETTTATTEQSTTTRTEPTTSEIKTTSASTTEPQTTTQSSTTVTSPATSTWFSTSSSEHCDAYCASITPGSYCKYWQIPSVCQGNGMACTCGESSTTMTPVSTTTVAHETTSVSTSAGATCAAGDAYCSSLREGSYCKYWGIPSVCSVTNAHCTCGAATTTASTVSTTGATTTAQEATTTTQTTPTSDLTCDAYCASIMTGSYCKYWQIPSVCSGSNKPCECIV